MGVRIGETMKSIIFQGWGVNAILEGRKTMTRRIMKPQPERIPSHVFEMTPKRFRKSEYWWSSAAFQSMIPLNEIQSCSPFKPGDIVYVKEGWAVHGRWNNIKPRHIDAERAEFRWFAIDGKERAELQKCGQWRSPLFMPEWASRIKLRITDVRAERLQEITEDDAKKEGVSLWFPKTDNLKKHLPNGSYRNGFHEKWDELSSKSKPSKQNPYTGKPEKCKVSYPWEDKQYRNSYINAATRCMNIYTIGNPWVLVYTFEVIS